MHINLSLQIYEKDLSISCHHRQTSPDSSLGKEGSKLTQALFTILWSTSTHPLAREGLLGAIFSHSFWRVAWKLFHDSNFVAETLSCKILNPSHKMEVLGLSYTPTRCMPCVELYELHYLALRSEKAKSGLDPRTQEYLNSWCLNSILALSTYPCHVLKNI